MRFVIDECIDRSVTDYLRKAGHEVLAIVESAPRADDVDILEWAEAQDRILITNDKDFGELVFRDYRTHKGVLLLRLRDESAANQVSIIAAALSQYADRLSNQFATIREESIRIQGNLILLLTDDAKLE